MPIHRRCTLQQFLKPRPAKCHCGGKANARPERIPPTNRFIKRQDARFINAPFNCLLWCCGQRDHLANRIINPRLCHPFKRTCGVEQGFARRECFRCHSDQRLMRIKALKHFGKCGAVDIGNHRDIITPCVACERVDQKIRPKCRSADPDVKDMRNLTHRTGINHFDQAAHPAMQCFGARDTFWRTFAAFRAMFGGAAFGDVDDQTAEQRVSFGQ